MSITAVFYLADSVEVMKTSNRANWRVSDSTASGHVSPKAKWTTMPPEHLAKVAGAAVLLLFPFISPVPRGHRS